MKDFKEYWGGFVEGIGGWRTVVTVVAVVTAGLAFFYFAVKAEARFDIECQSPVFLDTRMVSYDGKVFSTVYMYRCADGVVRESSRLVPGAKAQVQP